MKLSNCLLIICSFILLTGCKAGNKNPRITSNLNSNWTFNYSPAPQVNEEFLSVEFDDSSWPVVGLPHTWQTYETTGDLHPFIRSASERDDPYWWKGWGYYRKHFSVSEELADRTVTIEFDGVQKYSRIYLNGHYVGDHKGGFNSFYFDLTPFIHFDGDNVLSVAVNNRRDDIYRIPPMYAGNWDVYGGIYRDARLVIKNRVHIPYQGSYKHEGGTFITTPRVNINEAEVNIKTYVKNGTGKEKGVTLKTSVISPGGDIIEEIESTETISPGVIFEFVQTSSPVQNPELWHPDSPNLYRVRSEVYADDLLVDIKESPLGFRWFHWDYENNDLWLNGIRMPIRGFNRHQEYPWVGDAIPKWLTEQDFTDMKVNLGINFFRAAHYPNDPQVYELADRLGMVAVEEVPNIKSIDFSEKIQKQNVQEMIRRDRNHPSILFWSVGNETSDAADSKWVIDEDSTRLVHARKAEEAGDFVDHDHTNLDMENLLRVTVRGYFDKDNAPAGRNLNPDDGQWCSTEEWQHERALMEGGSVRGSLKKNTVLWLYEDHGADREYRNSPLKHVNYKGWVDLYRIPKYTYYLTQAMYTSKPMVFIHPHNWTPKYLGKERDIIVNSNCEKVELFVNEVKVGEALPDYENYYTVTFPGVEISKGTIKAVGTRKREKVENSVTMSGEPSQLKLTVSRHKISAGKNGMAIVTAHILDNDKNPVIHAVNPLYWSVEGAASLIGPAVYETDFELFESMEGTGYIHPPVSNIIRSANRPGKAKVTVSSPRLDPASVEIEVLSFTMDRRGIFQPELSEEGRQKVVRDNHYKFEIKEMNELLPVSGNVTFDITERDKLEEDFTKFLQTNNPGFREELPESAVLVDYFTSYLIRMNGELIGDDFNFLAGRYNDLRLISIAIDQSNLWFDLASELKRDYSERIIINGESVNALEEADIFTKLPGEQIVFRRVENPKETDPWIPGVWSREPVSCYFTDLESLIELAYPAYIQLSAGQKNSYKNYVDAINPGLEKKNDKFEFSDNVLFCLPDPEIL